MEADEFAAKNVEFTDRLLPDELQDLFGLRSHSNRDRRRRPLCGINDILRRTFGPAERSAPVVRSAPMSTARR